MGSARPPGPPSSTHACCLHHGRGVIMECWSMRRCQGPGGPDPGSAASQAIGGGSGRRPGRVTLPVSRTVLLARYCAPLVGVPAQRNVWSSVAGHCNDLDSMAYTDTLGLRPGTLLDTLELAFSGGRGSRLDWERFADGVPVGFRDAVHYQVQRGTGPGTATNPQRPPRSRCSPPP